MLQIRHEGSMTHYHKLTVQESWEDMETVNMSPKNTFYKLFC